MSESSVFDCECFGSLTGTALATYAEPFVNSQTGTIPESAYEWLTAHLSALDVEHTVYALALGVRLRPEEFVRRAVAYLADTNAAVCCAAYNALSRLPAIAVPPDVVAAIAATPTVELFAPDFRSGTRARVATNEQFVRDLVAKFARKPCAEA
jgi:hypothetical protein